MDTKKLWEIEKEAKLLIFPLFEDQSVPTAQASIKQEPKDLVFKLDKDGEVNYPFFISNRISPESKPEYMEVVAGLLSHCKDLNEDQAKIIVNVFANYQDVCKHFYTAAYGNTHAMSMSHFFGSMLNECITIMAQVCNKKEALQDSAKEINQELFVMKESGNPEDIKASVAISELDPLTKVFSYIVYKITNVQTRFLRERFVMHDHVNTMVEQQMQRLGIIFREVLCSVHDRIAN